MINQATRRLDAEKIRQDFIKSKKLDINLKAAAYPRPVAAQQQKSVN
jgi:hypothetical protein